MTKLSELDDAIRAWCAERGLRVKPWECHPADARDGPPPWPAGTCGAASWVPAQRLRRRIIRELRAAEGG